MLLFVLATAVGLFGSFQVAPTAEAKGTTSSKYTESGKELTVAPNYDGMTRFTVNSLEYHDGLPDYDLSVTDVGTGQQVPLGYGYASRTPSYSEFEDDYTVASTAPLTVGREYQVYFHVETMRFWHCSIYDEDGCSYLAAEHTTSLWRFTYTGTQQIATPHTIATSLKITGKKKWNAHGWQILVTLSADGGPFNGAPLIGEYRVGNHGRWLEDDGGFVTNKYGQTKVRFHGEKQPTQYRLHYEGSEIAAPTISKVISIKRRP